jgi:hypothetical protein
MRRATANKNAALAAEIKRQASAGLLQRYATSLPPYKASQDIPRYFVDMLEKLKAAEKQAQR